MGLSSLFFFFSSRRRHTRWNCDWSSDVCSSDLSDPRGVQGVDAIRFNATGTLYGGGWDRSEERRVGKSVDLGGRRIIKKKKKKNIKKNEFKKIEEKKRDCIRDW